MAKPTPVRRTSSLAYDNNDGFKENYHRVDMWRKRRNLPLKPRYTTTALSSSASSSITQLDEVENSACNSKPMYTFGVLADIQYAPIPDGHSYSGNPRYYQHAKEAARHAAIHFQEEQVQCVINLGDIVDGKCADVEKWGGTIDEEKKSDGCSSSSVGHDAIDDVLEALSPYNAGRILHTYGNHELYNLSRFELGHKLSIPFIREPTNELVGYYDHVLHEPQRQHCDDDNANPWKLRFVVLDSYDICLLDRCAETSKKRQAAHEILSRHNPNYPEQENSPEGLVGLSRRFVAFNGGVDTPQLEWLESSMQSARENGEKVIICSHQPIHPQSSFTTCLIWNYDDVLSIVRKYSDVVIASFSGHAHKGGYIRDEDCGVHFRTFEAMLESPCPIRTYAFVDVWKDRLVVRGMGDCFSDVYDLDHLESKVGTTIAK
jgi:manganese-dependent ADP-ribose/CDP-alcohol diphosphatase